jgi:putative DNA primase/helicase
MMLESACPSFRPHNSADFITKRSPVAYDPAARCPRWNAFMDRIMGGDTEMIAFVQRCAGYSLTGFTKEEVMFFLFGSGANGKSTMRETLRKIWGDYAAEADISTFLVQRYQGGPRPDLARLEGVRMVTTTEVPAGKQLDEALVKSVTSSDMLTVRSLYKQPFEFRPQFKLWVCGNHKPQIRSTDDGIWRRILLTPFLVQIPVEERDPDLAEKLQSELPGILNWVLQGCRDWQQCGLMPPKKVIDATFDYRRSSDVLGQFIAEECVIGDNRTASTRHLYERYTAWCEDGRMHAMPMNKFGQALEERGFAGYSRGHEKTSFRRGIAPSCTVAG